MAKRKVTVTVDEELVEAVSSFGDSSLSAVVNAALVREIDRRARRAALGRLLDEWESKFGPVPDSDATVAAAAFDDAEAGSENVPA